MAYDLNFRETAVGAQAKIVLTLAFTNGRTDLSDVASVKFWFWSKADPTKVVGLTGAVVSPSGLDVSLTMTGADWTAMANAEHWYLTVDLTTNDSSVIPVPEASRGYSVKFHQHPNKL